MTNKIIFELYADDLVSSFSDISKNESEAILEGFRWFNIFKRLLVDVTFSSDLLWKSQDRFSEINPTEALKLVNIELSFLYDTLHTKAVHIHCILGRVMRFSSLVSIIAALIAFHQLDLQKYASNDIIITYVLFGAGLSLEVISTMLLVFSDWTVVSLTRRKWCKRFASCITVTVNGTWRTGKPRWSRTIGQYNLVGLCLRDSNTVFAWIMKKINIKNKWDNIWESSSIPLLRGLLEEIMFTEAKRRAQNMHIYNVLVKARSYRGRKALERHGQLKNLEWSMKREFDECIILWHVATDICYYNNEPSNQPNGKIDTVCDVSWKTSNYMAYLLTQHQSMMQLGYGKTRFEATCSVVKKILKAKRKHDEAARQQQQSMMQLACAVVKKIFKGQRIKDQEARHEVQNYKTVLDDNGQLAQGSSKDDEDEMGELVLKDCRRLAKQLQEIKPELNKWQLISETWMEMLGYAAIHCDSYQHAKSLSRGGELLTHFWLLMSQLGVVEERKMQQFQSGSV